MTADAARAKSLFLAASELTDPAARAAFLESECGGDAQLRQRVDLLLRANDVAPLPPLGEVAATVESAVGLSPTQDYADPTARVGSTLSGKYKLIEEIGVGGMGCVYMAQQTEPVKRSVAVKVVKAGMDSRAVLARFEAERQALAMMDHPNIAKVLDAGTTDAGRPYFVMELVRGVPITQFCDQRKLTLRQRLELFVPVCLAIQHAHQKGIIHRDIKPTNVLVALYDDRAVPKVIDFGVAKATGPVLTDLSLVTGFGAVVGTPEYMSPEQAQLNNLDIDSRSDVYSLGVLLFELLTGTTPVDRKSLGQAAVLEILRIVREVEAPRPSTRLSGLDTLPSVAANRRTDPARLSKLMASELDWVVLKALDKDRTRRYEMASALARDIQRYLENELVEARPPSAGYRLSKFLRRNRGLVATSSLVIVAVLTGALVATWQAIRATRAEQRATDQRDLAREAQLGEQAARASAESALHATLRGNVRMIYERGQALCEQGQADFGLQWMARGVERMPPASEDLDRAIRLSLNLWAGQLDTVHRLEQQPQWGGVVEDLAVSPDGLSLLTIDSTGNARLFELSTGKLRFELAWGQDAASHGARPLVAFSPEGRFLAAARGDASVRIWNTVNGNPVRTLDAQGEPARGIAFDPTGNILVVASGTELQFWNVEKGTPSGKAVTFGQELNGLQFARDGRRIVVWSSGEIHVLDVATRTSERSLPGVGFPVESACFSPDGRWLFANGRQAGDSVAQFWNAETGEPQGTRMRWVDRRSQGQMACFRPDGEVAVTSGFPLRAWRVPTGQPLGATVGMFGAERLAFHPQGRLLAAFGRTSTPELFDSAPRLLPAQRIPLTEIHELSAVPHGTAVVVSHWSGARHSFHLLDLATGTELGESMEMTVSSPSSVPMRPAFSANGRYLAIGSGNNACQIWDVRTGRPHGPRLETAAPVRATAFSANGQLLAGGCEDGIARLWRAETGQPLEYQIEHQLAISSLQFSPDGNYLLVAGGQPGSIRGEARIWNVATGQPAGPALELVGEVRDAAFSPDGKTFVTGAFELAMWDAATSRRVWTAPGLGSTMRLAFSPDGDRLVAAQMEENAALIIDTRTGSPASAPLQHQDLLRDVAFSPDGQWVLTCSADRRARLWDAATGLALGPVWTNQTREMRGCFASDGRGVLLCDDEGIARWDVPPPLEGTPSQVRLAVEAATRCELSPYGNIRPLYPSLDPESLRQPPVRFGPDPHEAVWRQLREQGGPPGLLRR
ncbi:MAG: protein kinase [Pirellulaceae bacterium]|nr:protein kinase [Pirellulaceae bacterium]